MVGKKWCSYYTWNTKTIKKKKKSERSEIYNGICLWALGKEEQPRFSWSKATVMISAELIKQREFCRAPLFNRKYRQLWRQGELPMPRDVTLLVIKYKVSHETTDTDTKDSKDYIYMFVHIYIHLYICIKNI